MDPLRTGANRWYVSHDQTPLGWHAGSGRWRLIRVSSVRWAISLDYSASLSPSPLPLPILGRLRLRWLKADLGRIPPSLRLETSRASRTA